MMEIVAAVCYGLLALSGVLCAGRVATGPTLADRAVALDTLLVVGVIAVAIETARTGSGVYLDVLLIVALVAFVGTTAVARFIERRGAE
jgi:multicomponent Na+:H+ antiporter subunit F